DSQNPWLRLPPSRRRPLTVEWPMSKNPLDQGWTAHRLAFEEAAHRSHVVGRCRYLIAAPRLDLGTVRELARREHYAIASDAFIEMMSLDSGAHVSLIFETLAGSSNFQAVRLASALRALPTRIVKTPDIHGLIADPATPADRRN